MNVFDYLNPAQLARAIRTVKNYIEVDTRYSSNVSGGKVTFTNNLTHLMSDDPEAAEMVFYIDLACAQDSLHEAAKDVTHRIASSWTRNCYYYESFDAFVRQSFDISEHQYRTLNNFAQA